MYWIQLIYLPKFIRRGQKGPKGEYLKKVVIVFIIITLLAPAMLSARGNPEVGLPLVDRLIKERNYNEAILVLAEYMTEHPEDFDGAQRRVRRIITMREGYNEQALELLDVIANEPTNDAKKLDMITSLESMEKNPNERTQNFIRNTKEAAQFTYYRARFDEIMDEGFALIEQGEYARAGFKFSEGYSFYKTEFDEEASPALVTEVNSRLGRLSMLLTGYQTLQAEVDAAAANAELQVREKNFSEIDASLSSFRQALERLSVQRNEIAQTGWYLADTFQKEQERTGVATDTSFLPFAWRFTLGRDTAERFEGVLGAYDAQWNHRLDSLESAVQTVVRESWNTAQGSVQTAMSPEIPVSEAGRILAAGRSFTDVSGLFEMRDTTFGKRDVASTNTRYDEIGVHLESLAALAGIRDEFDVVHERIETYAATAPTTTELRDNTDPGTAGYAGFLDQLENFSERIATVSAPVESSQTVPEYRSDYLARRDEILDAIASDRLALHREYARHRSEAVALIADEWQSLYQDAITRLDGIPSEDGTTTFYYPREALDDLTCVQTGITEDQGMLGRIVSDMQTVPPDVLEDSEYGTRLASIQAMQEELAVLAVGTGEQITRANTMVLQANLARQEAELRYGQARSALQRNDFQAARDNLQRSRERYNQALALQESPELRSESDRLLAALGSEITRTENEYVVREVRQLILTGRNHYYMGSFEQAEQTFIQARNRWRVTNIEDNAEVQHWLTIVDTALSMKTGRTIPVSAPLYPQMSQMLSSASTLYLQGRQLMGAGQRTEAIAALSNARKKLQQVQLVYPLNREAGELTLRIDQVIDPESFRSFFRQKVDYIRANYRSEGRTLYSELLDLYEIDSDFPGLKKLVDDVEIYLGIKIPPPDPASIARSSELTRSARRIYDANSRSVFQVALSQLDEAIRLNPDNQEAITLKDRMQTAVGGQAVAVLSAEDEERYQQAVRELQRGNKITASALVEQLMQSPGSRNSAKIADLKRRIDSQL